MIMEYLKGRLIFKRSANYNFYDRQISFNSQNTLMRATITVKTRSYREKCLFTFVKFFWSRFFLIHPVHSFERATLID